jgi:hypothetical protein
VADPHAIDGGELADLPLVVAGELLACHRCDGEHVVLDSSSGTMQAYECGGKTYIVGVRNRDVRSTFLRPGR